MCVKNIKKTYIAIVRFSKYAVILIFIIGVVVIGYIKVCSQTLFSKNIRNEVYGRERKKMSCEMLHVIHFQIDYANKFIIYENYSLLQEEKEKPLCRIENFL